MHSAINQQIVVNGRQSNLVDADCVSRFFVFLCLLCS